MLTTTQVPASAAPPGGFTQFPAAATFQRLDSVDLLRGLVMVIMALDHTRDYLTYLRFPPEILSLTYPSLFFTRWITHFCAPCFFFLAGTGAYLSRSRGKSAAQISNFLWKRGLWLIFLEATVLYFAWTFQPPPPGVLLVIWALGCSMIFLALIVRLPFSAISVISVGMIALHNLFDHVTPAAFGKLSWLWIILHQPGFVPIKPPQFGIFFLYPLVPWIGVMGAGYAFGALLKKPSQQRRKLLVALGAAMVVLFVLLRATNIYGNPPADAPFLAGGPFVPQKTLAMSVIAFLNVAKYPPSLDFLLMTLGPAFLLLAWFDTFDFKSAAGKLWRTVLVYGRVPMFYYVLHIFLVHLAAIAVAAIFHQPAGFLLHGGFFSGQPPNGYGHGLPFIYLVWFLAVAALYYPCKWFAGVKQRRRDWWLSYL